MSDQDYRDIDWQRVAEDALKKAAAAEQLLARATAPVDRVASALSFFAGAIGAASLVFVIFNVHRTNHLPETCQKAGYAQVEGTVLVKSYGLTGTVPFTVHVPLVTHEPPLDNGRRSIVVRFTEIE